MATNKKTAEELFKEKLSKFSKDCYKKSDKLKTTPIKARIAPIISLVDALMYDAHSIKSITRVLEDSIRSFDDYKNSSLATLRQSEIDNKLILSQASSASQQASKASGKARTEVTNETKKYAEFNKSIKAFRDDFKKADEIISEVHSFIITETKTALKSLKKEKGYDIAKKGLVTGIGAMFGLKSIGAIGAYERSKGKLKEFNSATKREKGLMALQGASVVLGAMTGSGLGLMASEYLGNKINKEKQTFNNIIQINKKANKSISKSDSNNPFTLDSLSKANSIVPLKQLSQDQKDLLASFNNPAMKDQYNSLKNQYRKQGYRLHAKGGMFETKGPIAFGRDVFGESGTEKLKAIGKDGDPAANEIKRTNKLIEKTNSLLGDLVESNKNMLEDQVEENAKKGLQRKSSTPEKKDSILGNVTKEDDKEDDKKPSGLLSKLKEKAINRVGNTLGKFGKVGKLLGGMASMASDATPVYVVNASDFGGMGGSPFGGGKLLGVGGATLGAGALAGFGVYDAYKAATTGKSTSNDITRKVGLVKSKEDIEKGTDSRSKWNPLSWAGRGIDSLASGAASVANFVSGETSQSEQAKKKELADNNLKAALARKAARENKANTPGASKPQEVIVKDDKSKQTAEQLKLARATSTNTETNTTTNTAMAEKADENKTLMEKLTSIWEDPSKSPLQKLGSGISASWQSAKQKVGGFFGKKSEFDISKLKDGTGSVAEKYESGGRGAGTISSGAGDFGGKSYGAHQLSSKSGTLGAFIKQSPYAKEFEGLTAGSAEFDAKWKDLAKNDPNFGKSQKDFIAKTHAAPQMDKLKALGLNTDSKALQEMAFSTGVQYGPESGIIGEALKASGKDPSKLSTKEIIEIVQDYKASSVGQKFKSSNGAVQQSVAQRHGVYEKADLLKIAEAEANGTLPQQVAQVKPKNVKEGSIANIRKNSTQGTEATNLKNRELATDEYNKAQANKGTQQAINNINVSGNQQGTPKSTPMIFTGDQVSFATRLAKSY